MAPSSCFALDPALGRNGSRRPGLGDLGPALGDVGEIDGLLRPLLLLEAVLGLVQRGTRLVKIRGGVLGRRAFAGPPVGGARADQLDRCDGGACRPAQREEERQGQGM